MKTLIALIVSQWLIVYQHNDYVVSIDTQSIKQKDTIIYFDIEAKYKNNIFDDGPACVKNDTFMAGYNRIDSLYSAKAFCSGYDKYNPQEFYAKFIKPNLDSILSKRNTKNK